MPKVYLSEQDRICHRMVSWAQGEKKRCGITDEKLADKHGISRSAWSRKFRIESMDFKDFVFLVQTFKPDDETLRFIVGL